MSNKIVSLHGDPVCRTAEVIPEVVAELEKHLEAARSGELAGVMMAVQYADETVSGSHVGITSYRTTGLLMQIIHDACAQRREERD